MRGVMANGGWYLSEAMTKALADLDAADADRDRLAGLLQGWLDIYDGRMTDPYERGRHYDATRKALNQEKP